MTRAATEKRGALTGGALTDEVIASSKSVLAPSRAGVAKGLQQYFTPPAVAGFIARVLATNHPVFDPTAGDGSLMAGFQAGQRYGVEIDQDQIDAGEYAALQGDIQQLFPLLRSVGLRWPVVVANPPFGLTWQVPGIEEPGSSTALGFFMARKLLDSFGVGVFVCGSDRFRREVAPNMKDGELLALVDVERLFPGVDLPCCIVFYRKDGHAKEVEYARVARVAELDGLVTRYSGAIGWIGLGSSQRADYHGDMRLVADEYARRRRLRVVGQLHTVELSAGRLSVKPHPFLTTMLRKERQLEWLNSFDKQAPSYFALQTKEWRRLLAMREAANPITIADDVIAAVEKSIDRARLAAVPLFELPAVQRLGFLDDLDTIACTVGDDARGFIAGQRYRVSCTTRVLMTKEQREKQTLEGPEMIDVVIERKAMEIRISGIKDGAGARLDDQVFTEGKDDLKYILSHFEVPDPGELVTRAPEAVRYWEGILAGVEREIQGRLPGFRFRWFQPRDLARLLCKSGGILAWEQGLGKALAQGVFVRALERAGRLPDGCALFVMPQDLAVPQFTDEMRRFFGVELLRITHAGDDQAHPRKRAVGEASALEVRELVWARRADLKAQRAGVQLAPRPAVWAVTWFEALAISGRESDDLPVIRVGRQEGVKRPPTEAGWRWDPVTKEDRWFPRVPAVMGWLPVWSSEQCPRCRIDAGGGWRNPICKCGYVHRALLRKPAYKILADLFHVVSVDEGTKIKGDDSLTSKAVRALRADYRLLCTGTPVKNFVVDLFWLLWWALGDGTARFPYMYKGGRERFLADFGVLETRLDDDYWDPKQSNRAPRKQSGARPKMLPEVSNLLRLWKMLCSSLVRRRMDEVGAVLELDGAWKCRSCGAANHHAVDGAWVKPDVLQCACGAASDAIVPLTYVPVQVPWGLAQRRLYADWLDKKTFVEHFKLKHPDSPLDSKVIPLMAAALGQVAKLEYATTDPAGDPDLARPEVLPAKLRTQGVSVWTPGRLKILELARQHAAAGDRVLIGSSLVAVGPWIAAELAATGINAVHITEDDGKGKARTLGPKQRAKSVADFRAGKAQVLCVGVQAMSLGHNLDVANVVIVDGLPWDFAGWDQFIKRARRLTSKRPVTVYIILPDNSLATKKWSRLKDKTAASDLALDGRLSAQDEAPIDQAALLRELQEHGVKFDGTEVPENLVFKAWRASAGGEACV